ncbi:MAG: hypothetical protein V5786_11335 [Psychromonas sp.]
MEKRIEFPLFELTVIIVLLLVLVVFSFPKFIEVGIEARIRALHATVLNLKAVNRLLYSRTLIAGREKSILQDAGFLDESDDGTYLVYGELRAQKNDVRHFLESDSLAYSKTKNTEILRLYLDQYKTPDCYIDYQQATGKVMLDGKYAIQRASYTVKTTGC